MKIYIILLQLFYYIVIHYVFPDYIPAVSTGVTVVDKYINKNLYLLTTTKQCVINHFKCLYKGFAVILINNCGIISSDKLPIVSNIYNSVLQYKDLMCCSSDVS